MLSSIFVPEFMHTVKVHASLQIYTRSPSSLYVCATTEMEDRVTAKKLSGIVPRCIRLLPFHLVAVRQGHDGMDEIQCDEGLTSECDIMLC